MSRIRIICANLTLAVATCVSGYGKDMPSLLMQETVLSTVFKRESVRRLLSTWSREARFAYSLEETLIPSSYGGVLWFDQSVVDVQISNPKLGAALEELRAKCGIGWVFDPRTGIINFFPDSEKTNVFAVMGTIHNGFQYKGFRGNVANCLGANIRAESTFRSTHETNGYGDNIEVLIKDSVTVRQILNAAVVDKQPVGGLIWTCTQSHDGVCYVKLGPFGASSSP